MQLAEGHEKCNGTFILKSKGKNSIDRPRPNCEDNINLDLKAETATTWTHFPASFS